MSEVMRGGVLYLNSDFVGNKKASSYRLLVGYRRLQLNNTLIYFLDMFVLKKKKLSLFLVLFIKMSLLFSNTYVRIKLTWSEW